MANESDPIREQVIEARRNQILDAAASEFAHKGFHRTTTKDIARQAGVSEGTIYNYFDSKNDVLLGILTRLTELDHLNEDLLQAMQHGTRDFLVATFRYRLGLVFKNRETFQAIMPEMLADPSLRQHFYQRFVSPTLGLFERYLQARIEQGDIRPVNVPLTVRSIQSMFVGLLILFLLGDEALQTNWEELPEALATILFEGINPRPETKQEA